jgi:multimeric flavodoxin WrbA
MKLLGISCSNRKHGNSYTLLKEVFNDFSSINAEIIQMAELQIKPCRLCFDECALKPFECAIDDDFHVAFGKMKSANGIVFACPFYFYIPSIFQAFMERMSCLDYYSERRGKEVRPFDGKPCALIAVSASGSSFNAFQILHHLQEFALMLGMRVVTTNEWPFIGISAKCGLEKGAVLGEEETIEKGKELVRALKREMDDRQRTNIDKPPE